MILRTRPYSHSDSFARYLFSHDTDRYPKLNTKDVEQYLFYFSSISFFFDLHAATVHYKTVQIYLDTR